MGNCAITEVVDGNCVEIFWQLQRAGEEKHESCLGPIDWWRTSFIANPCHTPSSLSIARSQLAQHNT